MTNLEFATGKGKDDEGRSVPNVLSHAQEPSSEASTTQRNKAPLRSGFMASWKKQAPGPRITAKCRRRVCSSLNQAKVSGASEGRIQQQQQQCPHPRACANQAAAQGCWMSGKAQLFFQPVSIKTCSLSLHLFMFARLCHHSLSTA